MTINCTFSTFEEMEAFAANIVNKVPVTKSEMTKKAKLEAALEESSEEAMEPSPEENIQSDEPAKPTVTLEQVRLKLTAIARGGKSAELSELLHSYGAKNITALDPKFYDEVMEKAGAL